MSEFIKSGTKYDGVYHKVLSNGDLTYYITYKVGKKKKWVKLGKASEGRAYLYDNEAFRP